MKCSKCDYVIPESNAFCGRCGAKTERKCSKCGNIVPPSNTFCGGCGNKLDDAASSATHEASLQAPVANRMEAVTTTSAKSKLTRQEYEAVRRYTEIDDYRKSNMRQAYPNLNFEELLKDEEILRDIRSPDQRSVLSSYEPALPSAHAANIITGRPASHDFIGRSTAAPYAGVHIGRPNAPGNSMLAPGRIFLLVTGIVYIVIGVFTVIGGLVLSMAGQALGGLGGMFGVPGLGAGVEFFAFISVVLGGFYFVMGVMGVAHRNNLEKATILITLGIIDIILDIVMGLSMGTFTIASALMLAIPICYIVGATKNKNAYL